MDGQIKEVISCVSKLCTVRMQWEKLHTFSSWCANQLKNNLMVPYPAVGGLVVLDMRDVFFLFSVILVKPSSKNRSVCTCTKPQFANFKIWNATRTRPAGAHSWKLAELSIHVQWWRSYRWHTAGAYSKIEPRTYLFIYFILTKKIKHKREISQRSNANAWSVEGYYL